MAEGQYDYDQESLEQSRQAGRGKLREVLANFDAAMMVDPDDAGIAYSRAWTIISNFPPFDGEAAIEEFEGKFPDDHRGHYLRGGLMTRSGRFEEALTEYRIAVADRNVPDRTAAHMADLLLNLGRRDEAIRLLVGQTGPHSRIAFYKAMPPQTVEQVNQMVDELREAKVMPDRILGRQVDALVALGKPQGAVTALEAYAKVDPNLEWVSLRLAYHYEESGMREAARSRYEAVFHANPLHEAASKWLFRDAMRSIRVVTAVRILATHFRALTSLSPGLKHALRKAKARSNARRTKKER